MNYYYYCLGYIWSQNWSFLSLLCPFVVQHMLSQQSRQVEILSHLSHKVDVSDMAVFLIKRREKESWQRNRIADRLMLSFPPRLLSHIAMKKCRIHMGSCGMLFFITLRVPNLIWRVEVQPQVERVSKGSLSRPIKAWVTDNVSACGWCPWWYYTAVLSHRLSKDPFHLGDGT